MNSYLPALFQPFELGSLILKNRIVMPPMVTNYASEGGFVTDRLIHYYQRRAEGGAGLIIVEASCVDTPEGRGYRQQLSIDDDKFMPGLASLVGAVQSHGAKIAIQLQHAGSEAKTRVTGLQPVAPSVVIKPSHDAPRELSVSDIQRLIRQFALAVDRARRAGFDGVELHGAHDYLLAQFLSSYFNRRSDPYGGGVPGRAKILIEILEAARALVGREYPVWYRMNGREYGTEAGLTLAEAQQVARFLQQAGSSAIHVSTYVYGINPRSSPPMSQAAGYMIRLAEAIKQAVDIPIICVGAIDAITGEKVIRDGKSHLVSIGRALISDPDLPNKAAKGEMADIRPCISCFNCLDCIREWQQPLQCTVNPEAGMEQEFIPTVSRQSKRVFVIGGGPGGMAAARVITLRGHQVTLYEKSDRLGGQLLTAALPPFKGALSLFTRYQISQLRKLGVNIVLEKALNANQIKELKPDVVVVATGAIPLLPSIPGIKSTKPVLATDVLADMIDIGKKVAIIGAELVGCETAEYLADKGIDVTLMRRGSAIATNVNPTTRNHLLARLELKNVKVYLGITYEEINKQGVIITTEDGTKKLIAADTVILASGSQPNMELRDSLKGSVKELYAIGDCVNPRNIRAALEEAYSLGFKI